MGGTAGDWFKLYFLFTATKASLQTAPPHHRTSSNQQGTPLLLAIHRSNSTGPVVYDTRLHSIPPRRQTCVNARSRSQSLTLTSSQQMPWEDQASDVPLRTSTRGETPPLHCPLPLPTPPTPPTPPTLHPPARSWHRIG